MSIEKAAAQGARGEAEIRRATQEGRDAMNHDLELQARWFEERGNKAKAREVRAEKLK